VTYLTRALVEAALVGATCAVVGVHVVLRRLSFFTMAMTHATFPGVVLAAILGLNLYLGGGVVGVLVVLAVAWLSRRPGTDGATAVGVVLSAGFGLGVALMSSRDGFTKDLAAFLVGSVLTVSTADVAVAAVVAAGVLAALAALGKELVLGAFDRDALVAGGYPALALDVALLLLVEVTVVAAVPAVGTILAVALVVAPAAIARLYCDSVAGTTAVAVGVGVGSGTVGVLLAQWAGTAAGATVVLVLVAVFAGSAVLAPRMRRRVSPGGRRTVPDRPAVDYGRQGMEV
jgi:ABC-type Mn2+/Zn2+ transport system permease subunit